MFTKNGVNEDVKRTLGMLDERRKKINDAPSTSLPKTYKVNELANNLHPNYTLAKISMIKDLSNGSKIITLKAKKFPYFRAGQYVTISIKINNKVYTRPYSILSSPNQALDGKLELGVQGAGLVSNYLINEAKVDEKVMVGEPAGDFYHDDIRDKDTIFAIAGGSGVTPFISMIKSILEGSEDFNIILLYGMKKPSDTMFTFASINNSKIRVIPVYSDIKIEHQEHGFITREIIKKYLNNKVSIFSCGPDAMYSFVRKELEALGIDLNSVRFEHNSLRNLKNEMPKTYNLTVHLRGEIYTIKAKENETLLKAMEEGGLLVPSRCQSGVCGFCHSRLIKGTYFTPKEHDHRRLADYKFNYIHPCSTYPTSDIEIDVPPVDELKVLL